MGIEFNVEGAPPHNPAELYRDNPDIAVQTVAHYLLEQSGVTGDAAHGEYDRIHSTLRSLIDGSRESDPNVHEAFRAFGAMLNENSVEQQPPQAQLTDGFNPDRFRTGE